MQADWVPDRKSALLERVPYSKNLHQYLLGMLPGTYLDISKHDHIYLEGYTHTDPIMASANRLNRRPNEVIGPMIDFMLSNSQ